MTNGFLHVFQEPPWGGHAWRIYCNLLIEDAHALLSHFPALIKAGEPRTVIRPSQTLTQAFWPWRNQPDRKVHCTSHLRSPGRVSFLHSFPWPHHWVLSAAFWWNNAGFQSSWKRNPEHYHGRQFLASFPWCLTTRNDLASLHSSPVTY